MEKLLLSLLKRMNSSSWILFMLLSFIIIAAVPIVKYLFNPPIIVLKLMALTFIPLVVFLTSNAILGIIYIIEVAKAYQNFKNIKPGFNLSVKNISRTLEVSPRAAYFLLEMAERGGGFSRTGTNTLNFKYLERIKES